MSRLYIGVMSGTSLDGVDIALCEIDAKECKLIASLEYPFDKELKKEILHIISNKITLKEVGILNNKLGNLFADAIKEFIKSHKIDADTIEVIGLHGQTIWHNPDGDFPFSMQLGCPNIVSAKTDIKVVTDFRAMDIANGGQGAPFAPAFHHFLFASKEKNIAVLNIGGMANITLLGSELLGFDTGCGNVLLDLWASIHTSSSYDIGGEFARSGKLHQELLDAMIKDDYFKKLPPKSCGREYFNQKWIAKYLCMFKSIKNEDIQRTLLELTAKSIANDIKNTKTDLLIVCGGGVKNLFLMGRLKELCAIEISTSDAYGVSSDFLEAMAFAWFAYRRVKREKVELCSVTGAKKSSLLGGIYG